MLTMVGAQTGSTIADKGIVVSNRAPIGYVARVASRSAFNQGCKVVESSVLDERFLMYVLLAAAPVLQALGQGTTFMEISTESLASVTVPIPDSPAQQCAIADYLDRETAKIDALIEKQSTLIDRLCERRAGVIIRAVTSGLGAQSDSDPAHYGACHSSWTRVKVNRVARIKLGKMLQSEPKGPLDVYSNYMRAAHVQPNGRTIDLDDDQRMWFSPRELCDHDLRIGDVVIVEGGAGFGRSSVLREDRPKWGFQNSIVRLRPIAGMAYGPFLDYAFQAALLDGRISLVCSTATIPHFTAEKVAALTLFVPSLTEQREIADYVDRETAKIDKLSSKAERFVELARERRSALITAAVTGQIEITEGAA